MPERKVIHFMDLDNILIDGNVDGVWFYDKKFIPVFNIESNITTDIMRSFIKIKEKFDFIDPKLEISRNLHVLRLYSHLPDFDVLINLNELPDDLDKTGRYMGIK